MAVASAPSRPVKRGWCHAALAVTFLCAHAFAAEGPRAVTVYAAASLTESLQQIGARFDATGSGVVRFSFAASSTLARQIEAGSPADVFFSADTEWMDYLEQRRLIRSPSRRNVLGNRLALVAPADSRLELRIAPNFPLRAALGQERLAMADPESVPAGRYACAALASLGVWDSVADRIVRADNVRGALMFVARGEVPLGIVYETDARVDRKVRIVNLFPESTHAPIVYPVALTSTAEPTAGRFLDYLRSAEAREIFAKYGFSVLAP
jgi:molybdate transport system substrate-binding protein